MAFARVTRDSGIGRVGDSSPGLNGDVANCGCGAMPQAALKHCPGHPADADSQLKLEDRHGSRLSFRPSRSAAIVDYRFPYPSNPLV
jgi:hypothetical protein